MEKGSKFSITGANKSIHVAENFSFQQTDTVNAWAYGGTQGLGPDLIMTGGSMTTPATLEVGGVNSGNVAAGYADNFALSSLTLGSGAYVELVDQNANATSSGWVSGDEALYLDGLFGVIPGNANIIPTLNLDDLFAYLQGSNGYLMDGLYTDPYGGEINIIGAPVVAVPEESTWAMMLLGFAGVGYAGFHRNRKRNVLANYLAVA
jgi:hypothetical protein